MKSGYPLFLVLLLLLFSSGIAFASTLDLDDPLHPLGQDSSILEGEDGRLTRAVKLSISDETGDVYRLKYKSDGLSITGFAVIPRSVFKGETLPVLIYGRGGRVEVEKAKLSEPVLKKWFLPMAVRNNYVILAPELRGVQGSEGKDEWGGREMNDISAMLKLARSLPFVQRDNIFFAGLSRGGTRAYLLSASEEPFRGVISIAGVSDFFSMFPSPKDEKRIMIPKQFGLNLEESFTKMSAVRWPEKIRIPLLILHGTNDSEVPLSQSQTLAKILQKINAPFKYVEIKGAEHHMLFSRTDQFEKVVFPWLHNLKK